MWNELGTTDVTDLRPVGGPGEAIDIHVVMNKACFGSFGESADYKVTSIPSTVLADEGDARVIGGRSEIAVAERRTPSRTRVPLAC